MIIYDLSFQKKQLEYNKVYTFSFTGSKTMPFVAGQWVHLGFPTPDRDKSRVRHMSFSSAPGEPFLEFSMDLGTGSWFKNQMAELKKDDVVKAFKISGEFVVEQETGKEIIFLVGGIGITPVRSILRDMTTNRSSVQWKLLHVSRDHFLYENELSQLGGEQWRTNRDGVDALWSRVIDHADRRRYYICGSDRFILGIQKRLASAQVTDIVTENFDNQ